VEGIGHGETVPTFRAATRENFSSVFGAHTLAEAVFVGALPVGWLIGSFHDVNSLCADGNGEGSAKVKENGDVFKYLGKVTV